MLFDLGDIGTLHTMWTSQYGSTICVVGVTNSEELYKLKNGPLWSILEAPSKNKRWTVK
jgi:hypothetical protein